MNILTGILMITVRMIRIKYDACPDGNIGARFFAKKEDADASSLC